MLDKPLIPFDIFRINTKEKTENLNALSQVCKNNGFDKSEAQVAVVSLMKFP